MTLQKEGRSLYLGIDRLILNRIQTPDGTILTSRSSWDYRTYKDANGFTYMVDGGLDYLRRNVVNTAPYKELSQYYNPANPAHNSKYLEWGTNGIRGNQPLKYVSVADMSTAHIKAVLGLMIPALYKQIMEDELEQRTLS